MWNHVKQPSYVRHHIKNREFVCKNKSWIFLQFVQIFSFSRVGYVDYLEIRFYLDNLDDNGTLGWLIEFGMVDHNSRNVDQETKLLKVPNFKQNQTTSQRRSFDEKNKEVSGSLGLYIRSTIDNQHYVTAVNAGSPAEEAGLRVYDKIISINKQPADHMQNHQVLKNLCQGPEIEVVVESDQA